MVGLTEDEQAAMQSGEDSEHAKLWDALTENIVAAGSSMLKLRQELEELRAEMLIREATLRRQLLGMIMITAATTIVLTKFIGG